MKYTADFETEVNPNETWVWLWGLCEINETYNYMWGTSLKTFFEFFENSTNDSNTIYFHGRLFDEPFFFTYLFLNGFEYVEKRKELKAKTFTCLISEMGTFYKCVICFSTKGKNKKTLTVENSMNLINMSVDKTAKAFGLPINKLEIDYAKPHPENYVPTEHEIKYLKHDVEIMARALHQMFSQGYERMTIGSNAFYTYVNMLGRKHFQKLFPIPHYDANVRDSYKGGFTYCMKRWAGKKINKPIQVFDVNSLYPSVMKLKPLPYGEGVPFKGRYRKDHFADLYPLYIQRFSCRFKLKPNHIPTIQIKKNSNFVETEYLEDSGPIPVVLCLTSVDLEIFYNHYDVFDENYINGWMWRAKTGLFDKYIDYFYEMKDEAGEDNPGMRQIAKLFLNSLYGKFAKNPRIVNKHPYIEDETGIIKYRKSDPEMVKPVYIPVGSFITAWARWTTITAAQKLYPYFIYADTDSLHLTGITIDEITKVIDVDGHKIGAWSHDKECRSGIYLRQKSYMLYARKPGTDKPYEKQVTCAGMPKEVHKYVTYENFKGGTTFVNTSVFNPSQFKGEVVNTPKGKLKRKNIKGGVYLADTPFTLKG